MLSHLSITNYAIIEALEVDFNNGLTVITGETGAGKSILLGALSLILGKRVDTSVLNDASKKCVIEGTFSISKTRFITFFDTHDLDFEEETTVRREISSAGKSRAFINDTPVNLSVLKEFSELLIDIHSQHQTLQVKDASFQVKVIDSFLNIGEEVKTYNLDYRKYTALKREYTTLVNQESSAKSDLDYIQFQVKEIEELNLQIGEQGHLESQLELINNAEDIKQVLHKSYELFNNTDNSILNTVKSLQDSFDKIAHCSDEYKNIAERLNSVLIELNDLSRETEILNDNSDFDAEKAGFITGRLNAIYGLEQKHQVKDSNDLLALLEKFQEQLNKINSFDEEIESIKTELIEQEKSLVKKAKLISVKREKGFPKLSKKILDNLAGLGMPDASFDVKNVVGSELNENGVDDIFFLFSANKGFEPKELYKAASGGELSRLMLTIKSILSQTNDISTILFDEIDTGVSGDVADKMGGIMQEMSNTIQVITITHLPQVAAKGNHHYKIFKEISNDKTITSLKVLSSNERVEELAKMLSGKKLTEAAMENAKNLISN